ncbi:MAG TPA: hypothetical protein DCQ36_06875, partial [Actinobacteria bacterium]|nr:hypothetical protein [Actinomycetota bacterium]
ADGVADGVGVPVARRCVTEAVESDDGGALGFAAGDDDAALGVAAGVTGALALDRGADVEGGDTAGPGPGDADGADGVVDERVRSLGESRGAAGGG